MADTNAKTIQDLNQTTTVSGDDLMVVAQSGSNEATKATVSTLAEAVGELNSTGALSELSLATSIGKNLLAQTLTNKGVPTDPSETLVQMADKLSCLQIDNTTENIVAYYQVSNYAKDPTGVGTARVFKQPLTGDMLVTFGTTIYYVPYADNYTSFSDIIAAATHSFDVTTIDSSYKLALSAANSFCVSEDFTKILVTVDSANSVHLVFNVSNEQGFTLLHTVNRIFNTSYPICAIDDTGNIIAYIPSTVVKRGFTMYNTSNDTDYPYVFANDSASYFVDMLIKNNKLYAYRSDRSSASYDNLSSVKYAIAEDGAVSFSNAVVSNTLGRSGYAGYVNGNFWLHQPGIVGDPIYVLVKDGGYRITTASNNYRAYYTTSLPQLWFTKNLYGSNPVTMKGLALLAGDSDIDVFLTALKMAHITAENGVYTLKMPGVVPIKVDSENSSYEIDTKNDTVASYIYLAHDSNRVLMNGIYSSLTTGICLISTQQPSPNMLAVLYKIQMSTDDMPKKLLAKRRTVNGVTVYYDPMLTRNDINSTAYDVKMTTVPLPEPDAQEDNLSLIHI